MKNVKLLNKILLLILFKFNFPAGDFFLGVNSRLNMRNGSLRGLPRA